MGSGGDRLIHQDPSDPFKPQSLEPSALSRSFLRSFWLLAEPRKRLQSCNARNEMASLVSCFSASSVSRKPPPHAGGLLPCRCSPHPALAAAATTGPGTGSSRRGGEVAPLRAAMQDSLLGELQRERQQQQQQQGGVPDLSATRRTYHFIDSRWPGLEQVLHTTGRAARAQRSIHWPLPPPVLLNMHCH